MKVLSKKKVETLFDDIMTITLICSDALKNQIIKNDVDVKTTLRLNRLLIERTANAVCALRGLLGVRTAQLIHEKWNDERLKSLIEEEAKNDDLDNMEETK